MLCTVLLFYISINNLNFMQLNRCNKGNKCSATSFICMYISIFKIIKKRL